MADCPSCGAGLETPLGCAACGGLFEPVGEPTPFELFGWTPRYTLDAAELRKRLLRFSRILHPDYFAGRPEEALAERNSALLNRAHELLSDDLLRAEWLVGALGGPTESQERAMPQAFLMEVLEWNETLDAARSADADSPSRGELEALERELRAERARRLTAVAGILDAAPESGAPALTEARRDLNAVRYLDRALEQLTELRLDRAVRP